jgi:hypothetical protein
VEQFHECKTRTFSSETVKDIYIGPLYWTHRGVRSVQAICYIEGEHFVGGRLFGATSLTPPMT